VPLPDLALPKSNGYGDMFLLVKGAKSGLIKGESQDTVHANEIDVVSWSWGMQARPTLGGGTASGKAVINDLRIVKRVDSASTPLMSALRSNEMITKAVLTLRKAGKSPLEFLKITIEQGRLTGLSIEAGSRNASPDLFEDLTFSFNKITVEYVPQGQDGQAKGSTMFTDQWDENS
jgi:type VI secretion system secreted protein Hcp